MLAKHSQPKAFLRSCAERGNACQIVNTFAKNLQSVVLLQMRNKQLPPSYQRFAVAHHRLPTLNCIAIGKRRPNVHTKRFSTCPTLQRKSKLLNQCGVLNQQSFKSAFSPHTGGVVFNTPLLGLPKRATSKGQQKPAICWQNTPICPPRGGKNTKKRPCRVAKHFFCRNNIPSCLEIPLKKRKKDKFCACPFFCN